MTTCDYDVVVIGLGPAGARAAFAACSANHRVLAIDRKQAPGQPVQCAELVPALISQNVPDIKKHVIQGIDEMRTKIDGGPTTKTRPFRGHIINRASFDRSLVTLASEAGANCLFDCPVISVSKGLVELASKKKVSAQVIIGADGPRSLVGRAIGKENKELIYARQITVPLLKNHHSTDIFLSDRTTGGYSWLFPKSNVAHIGVGVSSNDRPALKQLTSKLHSDLIVSGTVGQQTLAITGGVIPVGGPLQACQFDDDHLTLLAGDAAGLTNPITGAGIYSAIVSGTLAGDAAISWIQGNKSAGKSYTDEMSEIFGASYEHALTKRKKLLEISDSGKALKSANFRNAWIAYPEYWI